MGKDYKRKKNSDGRMGETFVALPHVVLDSAAFQSLSHKAKALLLDIARQYNRRNNGALRCGMVYLSVRGWKSNDVITSAKKELLQAGLIFETCKGARPNKASLYALTWYDLSNPFDPRFDPEAENFKRGVFLDSEPKKAIIKKFLTPSRGVESATIAPPHGVESLHATPPHGAIKGVFTPCPTPPHGDHLENHLLRELNQQ